LFRDGKFVYGEITLKDGTHYKGSVTNMKKIGKGIIRKNNITYDGYFENDVFSGTGILE
jgi:hypothetical protein